MALISERQAMKSMSAKRRYQASYIGAVKQQQQKRRKADVMKAAAGENDEGGISASAENIVKAW